MNRVRRNRLQAHRHSGGWLIVVRRVHALRAEHTRYWRQSASMNSRRARRKASRFAAMENSCSPRDFTPMADPNSAYLWALRADSKGNLYAAGGSGAKVLRYDSAGKIDHCF